MKSTCYSRYAATISRYLISNKEGASNVQGNIKREVLKMNTQRVSNCASTSTNTENGPVITVKQGKLRGIEDKLYDGSTYYSFKGIPYAQPPIGKLRFKDPLPPLPWRGIYNATEHGPVCPQMNIFIKGVTEGDENCLFLNVYTRSPITSSPKAVMVFIHGGAFMTGSGNSDMLGPKYLLQHDVVLVTVNYRLEVLGFLCLDTAEVPGNAGMKDQTAALKWVKENIAQFGGDASNVTIFGESAGGVCVTYHMASPISRGLFHKAIAQSGVFLNNWGLGLDAKQRAFRVAKYLGKETEDPQELLEFLQGVPAKDLVQLTTRTLTSDEKNRGLPIHFAPIIERRFDGVQSFINDEPVNYLLQNKMSDVPFMIGYNSAEGIMMASQLLRKLEFFNKNFHYMVMKDISSNITESLQKEFGKRIKRFYFGDKDVTKSDVEKIVDLYSDLHFGYGTHLFLNLFKMFARSPVFFYKFSYDSDLSIIKKMMGFSHLKGACHADDLFSIFNSGMTEDTYNENEGVRQMVCTVTKLWTDFAKTGNPTPDQSVGVKWEPYTQDSKFYLNIDTVLSLENNMDEESVAFWNKLYRESGLPCITKSSL